VVPVPEKQISGTARVGAGFLLAVLVFSLAVSVSVYAFTLKRDALKFHTRDYSYFIEMAVKLTDPGLTKRYATNIEGNNLVGLQGIEGVKSIYHSIHTEYYRFVNALVYAIFSDTLPIYLLFAGIYFAPVLYAAWVSRDASGLRRNFLFLFILLYVLYPGAVPAITGELRSRFLYISAWSLAVIAVYYDRPFIEKLVFLAFLPFIREEGILLGAIVTGLNFVQLRGKPGRKMQTIVFTCILLAASAAFVGFMAWGEYNRIDNAYNPFNVVSRLISPPILGGFFLLAIGSLAAVWQITRRKPGLIQPILFWGIYSACLALCLLQFWRDFSGWYRYAVAIGPLSGWQIFLQTITWEQNSLFFGVLILPIFLLGSGSHHKPRPAAVAATALLCAVLALTTLFTLPAKLIEWKEQAGPAQLVWDFKRGHNRYHTGLLVDFATLQAFYDYETVVAYNRLPVWMVYPNLEERFYPKDKELAARAIQGGLEYAVISRESLGNVRELADMAGRELVEVESNGQFMVLQFR
jgi:hypothetical protein